MLKNCIHCGWPAHSGWTDHDYKVECSNPIQCKSWIRIYSRFKCHAENAWNKQNTKMMEVMSTITIKEIGNVVRLARRRMDMTQGNLAHGVDVSRNTISSYERGTQTPSLINLDKIFEMLKISLVIKMPEKGRRHEQQNSM